MKHPLIHNGMEVVVMGLGVSGKAAVEYFHRCGARVYVSEMRSREKLQAQEIELIERCCKGFEGGGHSEQFVCRGDMIFVSPGISPSNPLFLKAKSKGIMLVGELALAAKLLSPLTIAVTGTNGKTTVTSLLGDMMRRCYKNVFVGGNIGTPLLQCLMDAESYQVAIIEVSSFQLEYAGTFSPDVALLLNITPDHLDYHQNMVNYLRAKARIFDRQVDSGFAIISRDNAFCSEIADHLKGPEILDFGHDRKCSGYICESEVVVKWRDGVERYDLSRTGFDNYIGRQNSAAAILAARAGGCTPEQIAKSLHDFVALPHRMQEIARINGVLYCNDSKATNTGAVSSALQQISGKAVLIAGGRDKGEDYALLKPHVMKKVRKLILIGEAAERIASDLDGSVAIDFASSLDQAVEIAAMSAQMGDTVLLSPACASFDMFTSYGHRGESFVAAVKKLEQRFVQHS